MKVVVGGIRDDLTFKKVAAMLFLHFEGIEIVARSDKEEISCPYCGRSK